MVLRLFRRGVEKRTGDKPGKPHSDRSGKLAGRINAYNNTSVDGGRQTNTKSVSKTVVLAELVKVLANPSQLFELVKKSPIVYVGYVQNDSELRDIVKRCGDKPLLLSIRGNGCFTHAIYFDGRFYTLINGSVKVVNKLVNNNVRVVVYEIGSDVRPAIVQGKSF